MRMGERLAVLDQRAEPGLLDVAVPPMVLPTLVENAIKHGLSPLPEGGRIDIRARARPQDLVIEVATTAPASRPPAAAASAWPTPVRGWPALFGSRASLQLAAAAPRGVVARVRLPLQWQGRRISTVLPQSTPSRGPHSAAPWRLGLVGQSPRSRRRQWLPPAR